MDSGEGVHIRRESGIVNEGGQLVFVTALLTYIRGIIVIVPWNHWAFIGLLSMALMLCIGDRKKVSLYGILALGILVFIGLAMLDTTVVNRYLSPLPQEAGFEFTLRRFFHSTEHGRIELFSNLVVFIPFGFFLSEFLASAKRFSAGRRLGLATLAGFGLSLCIECLQLLLRVGFFELTDLVMNTLGAFVGALISAGLRKVVGERRRVV